MRQIDLLFVLVIGIACITPMGFSFQTNRFLALRLLSQFPTTSPSSSSSMISTSVRRIISRPATTHFTVKSCTSWKFLSQTTTTSLFSTESSSTPSPDSNTTPTAAVAAPVTGSIKSPELEILEIRVGKIVEIGKHPEADSLYVEKVDVGEATGPRTIVSGLVNFCSMEALLNRKVIVLCNLKPRPLKGITSQGMLLCASNADKTKVEPLTPAESVPVGELIQFAGHVINPAEAGNKATKAFGKIAEDFYVNDDHQATFKNIPFLTSAGPIVSPLKGKIS